MSWHGPSAPRVLGIATKSFVVASCASKLASTASRIFRWVSMAFICVIFPFARGFAKPRSNHTLPDFADVLGRFQNREHANTLHGKISRPTETSDARQSQYSVSHHRRADRRGGRARLQSLPDQEATGRPADQCRPERAEATQQVKQAAPLIMTLPNIKRFSVLLLGGLALFALATSAMQIRCRASR